MHLSEEYLIRNNINVPLVNHCGYSYCFVKSLFWELLVIKWFQEPNKVGYYNIQKIEPRGSGFEHADRHTEFVFYNKNHENTFKKLNHPISVYYEDYEDFILSLSFETVTDEKEVLIVLWEMFLRSLDDNIIHYNLFDKLSQTFFAQNNLDRFKIILENIEYLHSNNLEIYNNWKNHFLPYCGNYSFWLAKLIKKN